MSTALLTRMMEDSVETVKQATKALKCVAFTNMQLGDMIHRKSERVEKRIHCITEEINLLRADVLENVFNQRERNQQVREIEEDVERCQVLGNAKLVEALLAELKVLHDEGQREQILYRALRKAIKSRKRVKKSFQAEKKMIEDELRSFCQKQNLIQTLLHKCAKNSSSATTSQTSSASQSDCGSLEELEDGHHSSDDDHSHSSHEQEDDHELLARYQGKVNARNRTCSTCSTPPPSARRSNVRARRSLSVSFNLDTTDDEEMVSSRASIDSFQQEDKSEEPATKEVTEQTEEPVAAAAAAETAEVEPEAAPVEEATTVEKPLAKPTEPESDNATDASEEEDFVGQLMADHHDVQAVPQVAKTALI